MGRTGSAEERPENVPVGVKDEAGHTQYVSAQRSEAARHPVRPSEDDRERSGALRAKCAGISSARAATRSQS